VKIAKSYFFVISVSLMKIPISGKIPRSYGPPPLQKGAIGDFSALVPTHCGLFSCAVLYRVVHELLCGEFFGDRVVTSL
jgi:hypothetical protein